MRFATALTISTCLTATVCFADAPLWTSTQTIRHLSNSIVLVICSGNGLARDLAFQMAIQNCNTIAASELNSTFTVKSVVIETERESPRLYSETGSNKTVVGLKPKTKREHTVPIEAGFTTWLEVSYDLKDSKVASSDEPSVTADAAKPLLSDTSPLKSSNNTVEEKKLIQSDERVFVVTTIPKCMTLLIRGSKPRTQTCKSSVMTININSTSDTELIFIPPKGYAPKILKIEKGRLPASYDTNSIEVNFDAF